MVSRQGERMICQSGLAVALELLWAHQGERGRIGNIHGIFARRAPPAGRHPLPAMATSPARRGSPPERLAARQCAASPQGCPGGTAAGRVTWEGWRGAIANEMARAMAAHVVLLGPGSDARLAVYSPSE